MTNKNYNKGVYRERKLMREMREKGWVCIRSAGSHSPVDVVCLKGGMVMLFQVKSKGVYISLEEKQKMQDFGNTAGHAIITKIM